MTLFYSAATVSRDYIKSKINSQWKETIGRLYICSVGLLAAVPYFSTAFQTEYNLIVLF
jgi:hypothetical protein